MLSTTALRRKGGGVITAPAITADTSTTTTTTTTTTVVVEHNRHHENKNLGIGGVVSSELSAVKDDRHLLQEQNGHLEHQQQQQLHQQQQNHHQQQQQSSHLLLQAQSPPPLPPMRATVRRNYFGTGPFDKYWLNVDCCGLFCALFTYALHAYGVYTVVFILLPPWMSYVITDDDPAAVDGVVDGGGGGEGDVGVNVSDVGESAAAVLSSVVHGHHRYLTMTGQFHRTAFILVSVLAVVSHFKAMTTDPGAVPPDAKPLPDDSRDDDDAGAAANGNGHAPASGSRQQEAESLIGQPPRSPIKSSPAPTKSRKLCRRCKAFKPQRAHHCGICRRCIIKMDHHCPWVNNCVGIGNHKYFLLFVFYTFVSCLYSMALVIARFSTCVGSSSHEVHDAAGAGRHHRRHRHRNHAVCLDRPTHLLNVLGLVIEGLLFGMFTMCMIFDQLDVIRSKITHIDRLKGAEVGGSLEGITEVFGASRRSLRCGGNTPDNSRFRADWLSPFVKACFPPSEYNDMLGYCRPVPLCSKFTNGAAKHQEVEMQTTRSKIRNAAEIV